MTRMRLVSVVVPVYNSRRSLWRCLESIENQTYKDDIEVVIVDDGSTDDSLAIVESFRAKTRRCRVVSVSKVNGGPSSARNLAMRLCSGAYIAFLDSDDFWHPQKLEIVIPLMEARRISFVGHSFALSGNLDHDLIASQASPTVRRVGLLRLLAHNVVVTPSVVVGRECLQDFDTRMRYAEDHDLWIRMLDHVPLFFVDLPLVTLGRAPLSRGGLSSNISRMRLGELRMYLKFAFSKRIFIPFVPLLIAFSLSKHFLTVGKLIFGLRSTVSR